MVMIIYWYHRFLGIALNYVMENFMLQSLPYCKKYLNIPIPENDKKLYKEVGLD